MKNLSIFLLLLTIACNKNNTGSPFEDEPALSPITPGKIDEASGIADSRANTGFVWVVQDSGNEPALYLLKHDGTHGKKVFIKNATNRDWEDMAVAQNQVYIAETGDNNLNHAESYIYRFEEPAATVDTVTAVEKISFRYDQGFHDVEAMFVDPVSKDIYLVTKNDVKSKVYRLAYPQSLANVNTATFVADLSFTGAVGASYVNGELLIKTYGEIYFWRQGPTISDMLISAPLTLHYAQEPQGEAIAFSNSRNGFFTLSEKPSGIPAVSLGFYRRK